MNVGSKEKRVFEIMCVCTGGFVYLSMSERVSEKASGANAEMLCCDWSLYEHPRASKSIPR